MRVKYYVKDKTLNYTGFSDNSWAAKNVLEIIRTQRDKSWKIGYVHHGQKCETVTLLLIYSKALFG